MFDSCIHKSRDAFRAGHQSSRSLLSCWFARRFCIFAIGFSVALTLAAAFAAPTIAQDKFGEMKGFGNLNLPMVGPSVKFEAEYKVDDTGKGEVAVTAVLGPEYHIFSTTQAEGGTGLPTVIKLQGTDAKLTGDFKPDRKPEIHKTEYSDVPMEEFYGSVTWTAPIQLSNSEGEKPSQLKLKVDGQVCRQSCELIEEVVVAKLASAKSDSQDVAVEDAAPPGMSETPAAPSKSGSLLPKKNFGTTKSTSTNPSGFRADKTHAVWTASINPGTLKSGGIGVLEVTANCDAGYHVYQFVPGEDETTFRTLMVMSEKSAIQFGQPVTKAKLITDKYLEEAKYYGGKVVWLIPFKVPNATSGGQELPIELQIGFLTCNEGSCDEPSAVKFRGAVTVGEEQGTSESPLTVTQGNYNEVVENPALVSWIDGDIDVPATSRSMSRVAVDTTDSEASELDSEGAPAEGTQSLTAFHVFAALLGGFILNFMPCVLPVIGLKVMSFLNQAGNSHGRIVGLNLAYVGGILAVMLTLALLTVGAKFFADEAFGWGEQFTRLEFKVALACLVFAMALSFLGVWEIPIPGFATSSKSGELMEKEGAFGAFLKGVLTTILATPCSGPLLGSLFGLSLVLSPANVILLYLLVGIGMGLPFLVLCVWPGFLKFLPKPGAWMETLKQALAFPLLLTAVFFVTSISDGYRIATLILLIVVWFACWLIGRAPAFDKSKVRVAWLSGLGVIAIGTFVSFSYFGPFHSEIPWVPYNEAHLAKYRSEGKTVMLDFTAKWCLNCQVNTRVAIDRSKVAELVQENDVIPMLADWTDRSDEIRSKLKELQSNSIPLLVIYPPEPNADPILLRDLLYEQQVLDALEEAGPSQSRQVLTSAPVH